MVLKNIKFNRKDRGFTIVELLVVIVVIGILAAITIVSYTGVTSKANTSRAQTNAQSIQQVVEVMASEANGVYPATATSITNTTGTARVPSGVTVIPGLPGTSGAFTGTEPLNSGNGLTSIGYACVAALSTAGPCLGTGGRITYWDFTGAGARGTTLYVGTGTATVNFWNPAT